MYLYVGTLLQLLFIVGLVLRFWCRSLFRIDPDLDLKYSHVMSEFFVASNIKRELPPLT